MKEQQTNGQLKILKGLQLLQAFEISDFDASKFKNFDSSKHFNMKAKPIVAHQIKK
ncbi:hypothetical protein [Methanobacterium sp.]|uniref:hypothetical protein n=1 Tax=Methanobacterium sp. TaxID=2164 RepID=UPI003D660C6E